MSKPEPIATLLSLAAEGLQLRSAEECDRERLDLARAEIMRATSRLRPNFEPNLSAEEFARLAPSPKLRGLYGRYDVTRGSVAIIGQAGTGKTLTLRRIGRRLLAAAWRSGDVDAPIVGAHWTTGLELAISLREVRLGSPCEAMRTAQAAPLLFLDEVGQEGGDAHWLLHLVEKRYGPRPRPTISTSGLTREQLIGRYGTGAFRRLFEPTGLLLDLHEGAE